MREGGGDDEVLYLKLTLNLVFILKCQIFNFRKFPNNYGSNI